MPSLLLLLQVSGYFSILSGTLDSCEKRYKETFAYITNIDGERKILC